MKKQIVKKVLDNFIYDYGNNTPMAVYEAMQESQEAFLPGVVLCEAYEYETPETLFDLVSAIVANMEWAYTQVLRDAAEELKTNKEVMFFFQDVYYAIHKRVDTGFDISCYKTVEDISNENPQDGGICEGTELEAVGFMLDSEVSLWL